MTKRASRSARRTRWRPGAAAAMVLALAACAPTPTTGATTGAAAEPAAVARQRGEVRFTRLSDTVWMHSSDDDVAGFGKVVSHGLIVIDGARSLLIDSGWTDAQTEAILDWAERDLGKPVDRALFTHAHADKMGGVGAIKARGIATYALALSNELAAQRGLEPAAHDLTLAAGQAPLRLGPVSVFYPGGGHTADNIVAYVPDSHILFGGCLIRPGDAVDLGNTADADVAHWAEAARSVAARYPAARTVVPSHGPPGGWALLDHTIDLAATTGKQIGAAPH